MTKDQALVKYASEHIAKADEHYFPAARQTPNIAIYGDIATLLEGHAADITYAADKAGEYIAKVNDARLIQKYESNSTFFEKYIYNSPAKMARNEATRAFQNGAIQLGFKLGVPALTKAARSFSLEQNRKALYRNIWLVCHIFACEITNSRIEDFPAVKRVIDQMAWDMLQKTYSSVKQDSSLCPRSFDDLEKPLEFGQDQSFKESIARMLYILYSQKHLSTSYAKERSIDTENLMDAWFRIGLTCDYRTLFAEYKYAGDMNIIEYNRIADAWESLYEEIVHATPNIDKAAARKLHYVMLDYVPNSGSQKLARTGAKYAAEGGLIAAGILTENPLLMKAGASAAMSMFKDLSHTEVIGNVLKAANLSDTDIKQALQDAHQMQQTSAPWIGEKETV